MANYAKLDLFSVADKSFYGMPKPEQEVLLGIDHSSLKEDTRYYVKRSDDLKNEVVSTYKIFESKKEDYNKKLREKEIEIKTVSDNINLISTNIQRLKKPHELAMEDLNETYNKQRIEKELILTNELNGVTAINDKLQADQKHVDSFGEREGMHNREILEIKEKLEKEERALSEERLRIEKEKAAELAWFDEANTKIGEIKSDIENTEQTTKQDMEKFEYERSEQLKHLDFLRSQRQKILEKNKNLKRDIQLNDDGLSEYQTLNYQQAKKIKSLKMEVQYIKYRLSEELYRFTQQMEDLKRERVEMTGDLEQKIKVIAAHIEQKNMELKNLRFLSRTILHQKAEVDAFFLDSVDYIKEQISYQQTDPHSKKKNLVGMSSAGNINTTGLKNQFPTTKRQINAFAMCLREPTNKPQLDPSKKVDISDLDWEEKEKILRILYTKVNMGVSPGYWKQLTNVQKTKANDPNLHETDNNPFVETS